MPERPAAGRMFRGVNPARFLFVDVSRLLPVRGLLFDVGLRLYPREIAQSMPLSLESVSGPSS